MTIGFGRIQGSIFAERKLADATNGFLRSVERLSSGQRINRPSDDAAGLAVSESLSTRARVYTQAIRNTNDAISALNIADGSSQNLSEIVTRLKELAESAANGSFSRTQRLSLDKEATSLVDEFNRIAASTTFNGRRLLDPANARFLFQLGFGTGESLGLDIGKGLSRNVATGSLAAQSAPTTASNGAIEADFNGDGVPDLLTMEIFDISVRINNGSGTLTSTYSFNPGASVPSSVAVGDFNGDGKLDFVASYGVTTRVFVGDGSGSFAPSTTIAGANGGRVAVGDFNGDGRDDVGVSTATGVNVFSGLGSATFSSAVSTTLGESNFSLAVGDYNGDGIDDLVVGGFSKVTVLGGVLNSSLSQLANFTVGTSTSQVLLGDVNHDGLLDVVSSSNSGFRVLTQQSGGSLVNSTTIATVGFRRAALTDYDGDGNLDIVDGSVGYDVYRGTGSGGFQSALNLGSGVNFNDVAVLVADFNNDGVPDIFSASSDPSSDYFFSNTQQTSNIARLNLTTAQGARDALDSVAALLTTLGRERGTIGANQSRLASALSTLFSRVENYQAANARILSADVAEESANVVRQNILQETAATVLSQANQSPNLVLQLLSA